MERGGVGTPHASLRDAHGATGCGLARGLCSPHARRPDWRCQAARESTADPRRRCARRSLRGQTGAAALSRRCEFVRAACRGGCDRSGRARHAPFSGSRTTSVLPGVSSRKPACGLPSFSCHATMFGCAMLPCAGSGGRVCERTGTGAPRERPLLTTRSGPCRHPRSWHAERPAAACEGRETRGARLPARRLGHEVALLPSARAPLDLRGRQLLQVTRFRDRRHPCVALRLVHSSSANCGGLQPRILEESRFPASWRV